MLFHVPEEHNPDGVNYSTTVNPGAPATQLLRFQQTRQVIADALDFVDAGCDVDAQHLATVFPDITSFWWTNSQLPFTFVRQLGEAFGPRLTRLNLCDCALQEVPPQMALLVNLQQLDLSHNNIGWITSRLAHGLTQLRYIDIRHNPRLPRRLQKTAYQRPTMRRFLVSLGQADMVHRAHIAYWMAVLRRRLGMDRDVTALLGQALWALRFQVYSLSAKSSTKKRIR